MSKAKLTYTEKDKNNFIAEYIYKLDAKSLPSVFIANTVYFPETEEETQTFSVIIETRLCVGDKPTAQRLEDEFDTKREAKKWIEKVFATFKKGIKAAEKAIKAPQKAKPEAATKK